MALIEEYLEIEIFLLSEGASTWYSCQRNELNKFPIKVLLTTEHWRLTYQALIFISNRIREYRHLVHCKFKRGKYQYISSTLIFVQFT